MYNQPEEGTVHTIVPGFLLTVFMENFPKIRSLNYVEKRVVHVFIYMYVLIGEICNI